jgi:hypothetical protein
VCNSLDRAKKRGDLDAEDHQHIARTLERASPELGRASTTLRMHGTDAVREATDRYATLARHTVTILDNRQELTPDAREKLVQRFGAEREAFHRAIRATFGVRRIGPRS